MSKKEKKQKKERKKIGIIGEFKAFITRGNVVDMAVGVIIGGAFTAIVTSLNKDIISPVIALIGGTDFSYLQYVMGVGEEAPILAYGNFITAVVNFLITALIIFAIVKIMNGLGKLRKKKEEPAPEVPAEPTTKVCPYCMSEIAIAATRCPHCTSMLEE